MKKVLLFILFFVLGLCSNAQSPSTTVRIIKVYPNPSNGFIQIGVKAIDEKIISIKVHDIQGRIINTHSTIVEKGDNIITIDITNHPSGYYHLTMNENESVVAQGKFVKY